MMANNIQNAENAKSVSQDGPIGGRYVIQSEIGAGGMGVVYRALDRLTGHVVALKRVRADRLIYDDTLDDTAKVQLALAREFTMLAALRHPNIISVLDYGFDQALEPFFTMEYLDQALTLNNVGNLGGTLSLDGQIDLLIQILQALTYLHRRGILHRDLKPTNVLVTGDIAKVLDFGLATHHGDSGAVSGTLAYMAPELFDGAAPSIASDLYAVGVMAYEFLAGQHPYADSLMILGQALYDLPDLTQLKAPIAVGNVIAQLMVREPSARFQSANETILAFCLAIGRPPPPETEAIRESFLQAGPFIGREAEVTQIVESVEQAMTGHGAAWLIGGESGVGKSRLMEEVRVQTLVKGALVLRGQATNTGGSAYELWHDVLRWLTLLTDLSPLEAGVLRGLFPGLPGLPVEGDFVVPELTAEATRLRLFQVVEEVFVRCLEGLRQMNPSQAVLLMLEDLQWAGAGLGLLNRLLALSARFPLIFLGSYRSDDLPELPAQLPSMYHLALGRLSGAQIAAVSVSMLGDVGRDPKVIALLERETEGNLFFLVEIVRTLAEQAGRLDQIGQNALPMTVFSDRLKNTVQTRLSRLPATIRPLLYIAAVVGRQLDLDLLAAVANTETGFDLQRWLHTCADYAMIEIHDARWRFAHDKLREGLIDALSATARADLHQKVALGLEQVYPNALDNLAYHWDLAGVPEKARHFAGLAGDQAVRSGAFKQAAAYLERALTLMAVPPALDLLAEARLEKRLGEAYLGLDDTRQVRAHLEAAARKFGYPLVTEPTAVRVALVRETVIQIGHRLHAMIRPARPGVSSRAAKVGTSTHLTDVASVYHDHMMSSYFLNDSITASYTTVRGLNLVEAMAIDERKSAAYAGVALVSSLTLPRRISVAYNRLAYQAAQRTADSTGKATGLHMVGLVSAGHADWQLATSALYDSIEYNLTVGDLLRWQYTMNILVEIDYLRGNYVQSYARNEESMAASRRYGFDQIETWGYRRRATNLFRQGKVTEARDWLIESLPFYEKHTDLLNEANAYGLLASIWLRLGDSAAAQTAAARVSAILGDNAPLGYYLMDAYNGLAEVRFDAWITAAADESKRDAARHSLRQLEHYGRSFRVGKPRAALFSGQYHWHSGQPDKAVVAWQRGLNAAAAQQMPYERGLAMLALGQHTKESSSRMRYLSDAARQFEQIGTPHELTLATAAKDQT